MASKGQPTPDDCKAGLSGLIQEKENKTKEDEARCPSGTSVQQKMKEKRRKPLHRKRRQKVQNIKTDMSRPVELKKLIDTDLDWWH